MLTMTRCVGETIYLGDKTCITVYDRLRYHVLIGVLAPANARLHFGDTPLRPAVLPGGERFYLLTMLSMERFRVDDAEISVRFRPTYLGATSSRKRQIKIDVDAPLTVAIYREEIYLQRSQEAGQHRPIIPLSEWMHRANISISRGLAA